MKLSLLANHGEIGGGEVMLLRMAEAARNADVDVDVVGPIAPPELSDQCRRLGVPYIEIPSRSRFHYMRSLRAALGHEPDRLTWCNGLVPALALAGSPHRRVVHLHQVPSPTHRPAAAAARWGSLATVVPSRSMREAVDHAVVLENWSAEVAPLVARPPHSDAFTFGFMGRLSPVKGADVLAVAIDQLQQQDPGRFRLHVAGDFRFVNDRHRGAVEGAFGRLGQELERVGWVDPMAFLGSIDALVVPSVWAEPFGLVAIEAMAAAVPLVVTDAGALPEIVGSGYPWIARKGDPASLADVMTRLADASEIRRDYVARSRRRWERRFSPSAGEARFLALLAECAAK